MTRTELTRTELTQTEPTQTERFAARTGAGPPSPGAALELTLRRMRTVRSAWPAGDGVAVFHRVFLAVLESADPAVPPPGPLVVRLAERYLSAVETSADGGRTPACWRPLFHYRRHPDVRPRQFALAGIHALTAHDLAPAVVDLCRTAGCEPPAVEGEFDRVGDLLTLLEERIREDVAPAPELLKVTDPLAHLLGSWNLERAREAAWSSARVLWALRDVPPLAEEFRERMDEAAGLTARCMLTPWRPEPYRTELQRLSAQQDSGLR
ncbi:DUF5995 family protein [Streptomyces scopuliridis]|uniref:DUF5995 family protein n=1 Tax=Streptomyces scopuliridis TaxID=452529 RepID=UPI0035D6560F